MRDWSEVESVVVVSLTTTPGFQEQTQIIIMKVHPFSCVSACVSIHLAKFAFWWWTNLCCRVILYTSGLYGMLCLPKLIFMRSFVRSFVQPLPYSLSLSLSLSLRIFCTWIVFIIIKVGRYTWYTYSRLCVCVYSTLAHPFFTGNICLCNGNVVFLGSLLPEEDLS